MKASGALLYAFVGILLLGVACCAGFYTVIEARNPKSEAWEPIAGGVGAGVALLLGAGCFWRVINGSRQKKEASAASNLKCPKCGARTITRLAPDRVSPFPAYKCEACEVQLTTKPAQLAHALIGVAGVALVAFACYQLVSGQAKRVRGGGTLVLGIIVVQYCFRTMFLPAVKRAEEADEQASPP